MSVLDPLSCGFLKAFCYKTFTATPQNLTGNRIKQQTGEILMQQYESFQSVFQPDNFHVPYCKFKHFREITKPIQSLGKKHPAKKVEFLEIFSSENWDNLKERKTKHSLTDCKACLHNKKLRSTLAMIPIKSPAYIQKAKKAGLIESMVLQEKTKQIVTDLNRGYRKNYRTTFTTQFKKTLKVPTVKKTAKLIKKNIEELWERHVLKGSILICIIK